MQGISVYLRPKANVDDDRRFHAIRVFDDILGDLVGEEIMERFLYCMDCLQEKREKRFFTEIGNMFKPQSELLLCESIRGYNCGESHSLNAHQLSLMSSKKHTVTDLREFLKDGIQNIKKTTLSERKEELQRGDQVWIYRDGSTGPLNPVASMMPYAHVIVFTGNGMAVHVAKASPLSHGCMMGTIKKEPIASVIKPGDQGNDRIYSSCV